jgi:transmembrane sensor
MLKKQIHSKESTDPAGKSLEMMSGTKIAWDKSKDQVWAELESKLVSTAKLEKRIFFTPLVKLALAASILILAGISLIMQLTVRNIAVPAGEHSTVFLPDKSQVELNALSSISYKPLMYKFTRHIKFEGEAFFIVQPGKKFEVVSSKGITRVLGTRFNIFSRGSEYSVTCISGKVEVLETIRQNNVKLNPGEMVVAGPDGELEVQSGINTANTISWIRNRFSFTSAPLELVFKEIERQYDITITFPVTMDEKYTGSFNRTNSVESILNLVCKPFNLTYTRKSANEYSISSIE